jgi:hypothetical protein
MYAQVIHPQSRSFPMSPLWPFNPRQFFVLEPFNFFNYRHSCPLPYLYLFDRCSRPRVPPLSSRIMMTSDMGLFSKSAWRRHWLSRVTQSRLHKPSGKYPLHRLHSATNLKDGLIYLNSSAPSMFTLSSTIFKFQPIKVPNATSDLLP